VKLDPASAIAYINLSNLYYETGHLQATKDALQKAIKIDPELVRSMTNAPPTYNSE
jgi:tetratricopeptide (TPR) repeat protein